MTGFLFHRLPFSVTDPTLTQLNPADVEALGGSEFGAFGHWTLGGTSASLTDPNGAALTAQGTLPTYSSNYLTIPATAGNALISGLSDSLALENTICAVVRKAVGNTTDFLMGNFSNAAGNKGGGFSVTSGASYPRAMAGWSIGVGPNAALPGFSFTTGWQFVAMSRDFRAVSKPVKFLLGGTTAYEASFTGTYTLPPDPRLALGNMAYSLSSGTMDAAEFIVFPRALTATELTAVYNRSKARAAVRGLTVV